MTVAVVLFTSDLRPHDHPPLRAALAVAAEGGRHDVLVAAGVLPPAARERP